MQELIVSVHVAGAQHHVVAHLPIQRRQQRLRPFERHGQDVHHHVDPVGGDEPSNALRSAAVCSQVGALDGHGRGRRPGHADYLQAASAGGRCHRPTDKAVDAENEYPHRILKYRDRIQSTLSPNGGRT
jgi:hypothetical protein